MLWSLSYKRHWSTNDDMVLLLIADNCDIAFIKGMKEAVMVLRGAE